MYRSILSIVALVFVLGTFNLSFAQTEIASDNQVEAQSTGLTCQDFFRAGSIRSEIYTNLEQTVPGATINFAGTLTNGNPYPMVGGKLTVQVVMHDNSERTGEGILVDQFVALENMLLKAMATNEDISFDWTVPNNAPNGFYSALFAFTANGNYNLMEFNAPVDKNNPAEFEVINETSQKVVVLDRGQTAINGQNYDASADSLVFRNEETVVITTSIINPTDETKNIPLQWNQYAFNDLDDKNLRNTNTELVTLQPNETKEVSYQVKVQKEPMVYVTATTQDFSLKSLATAQFSRDGSNDAKTFFSSLSSFPITEGHEHIIFTCAKTLGLDKVEGSILTLTLTDKTDSVIHQYKHEGSIEGQSAVFADSFVSDKDYDLVTLNTKIERDGVLIEEVDITYDCHDIDPSLCLPEEEIVEAGVVDKNSSLNNIIMYGGGLLVIIILLLIFYFLRRTPTTVAALAFAIIGLAGLTGFASDASAQTGSISGNTCTVQVNRSSCDAQLSWSTSGAPGASVSNDTMSVVYSNQLSAFNYTATVVYGSNNVVLRSNNGTVLGSTNLTANCVGGASWNGYTCQGPAPAPPPPPVDGFVASPLTITRGGQVAFSWDCPARIGGEFSNWFGLQSLDTGIRYERTNANPDSYIHTFNSAGTFTVNGTCIAGNAAVSPPSGVMESNLNGTVVITVNSVPSATISGSGCTIAAGNNSCNGSVTWSISGASSPNVFNNDTSATYSSSASGNTSANLRYGGNAVVARDGSTILASTNLTASCTGGTSWNGSSCALPPPAGSISGSGCTIAAGNNACNGLVTWSISNASSPNVRNQSTGASHSSSASGNNSSISISYGTNNIAARDGSSVLASTNLTASCTGGTSWNGSSCALPPPTGSISGSGCTVAAGNSTCNGAVTWSTSNAPSPNVYNQSTGALYSSAASGNGVGASLSQGTNNVAVRNGGSALASTNLTASCAGGTSWNGSTCALPPPPTGSISGSGCTIAAGNSTCNGSLTWNISSASSPNVRNNDTGVTYSSSATGNNLSVNLRYGGNSIAARDGSTILNSTSLTASCAGGTSWNGSSCVLPAASATISGTGCTIPVGGVLCNGNVTWNIINAAVPNVYRTSSGATLSLSANGSTPFLAISYGNETIVARDGSTILASTDLTATCASGSSWNGFSCAAAPPCEPDGTVITNAYNCTTVGNVTPSNSLCCSGTMAGYCPAVGAVGPMMTCGGTPPPVNNSPNTPSITGPNSAQTSDSNTFTFNATDPNGDQVRYGIDWDNNSTVDQWAPSSGYVNSGTNRTGARIWNSAGSYTFKVLAQDDNGASSGWATHTIVISNPPVVPSINLTINSSNGPLTVNTNDPLNITWTTANVSSCSAFGAGWGPKAVGLSGSETISASASDNYILSCDALTDTVAVNVTNNAPNAPTIVASGGNSNIETESQSFTITSSDPDGDNIYYQIDWNNNSVVDGGDTTSAVVSSGTGINPSRTWPTAGSYTFQARAIDTSANQSGWTTHTVNITAPPAPPPNLSISIVDDTPSATFDPATGNYDNVNVTVGITNNGVTPISTSFDYIVDIDRDGDGVYEDPQTYSESSMVGGETKYANGGNVLFDNVPFVGATVRARVDTGNTINEANEADNTDTRVVAGTPPDPGLTLTIDPSDLVRGGANAELDWNITASYSMDCTLSGPALATVSFNTITDGTSGTATAGPITAKSEYTLVCTEPTTSTSFRDTVSIETTGTIEEI